MLRGFLGQDGRAARDTDHLGNVALLVRVLRVFRALRVLRIFGHQKKLRRVFVTIVRFVPIVPRFLCVFVVLFYGGAAIAVSLIPLWIHRRSAVS